MVEHALAYARLGLKVLPVWAPYGRLCSCGKEKCPSPGKHPHGVLGATGGLNLATTDEATITRWWTEAPEANIGIALRASGLVAFDVDKPENYAALAAAEARLGELPSTLLQISGSGNWHVIFRAPKHDVVGVFDGIVMRAKNFIVVAPSLHASGNRYAWKPGFGLGEAAPAELPAAWQDALKRPESVGEVGVPPESSEPAWLRAISSEERLRRMREHLAREPGEQKGVSGPGTAFNVTRTCARGFAIREADALLRVMIDDYDARCSPPYGAERVRQRVQKVYDQATSPSWGACLVPPDQSLADVIGAEAVDELAARRVQKAAELAAANDGEALWIEEVAEIEPVPTRYYTTGFAALDELMGGGLATQEVCGAVGGTGVGKSGFAGVVGLHVSDTLPVLHVSTELPRNQLFIRYAALVKKFMWRDGMKGKIPRAEMRDALRGRRIKLLGAEELPTGQELQYVFQQAIKLGMRTGVPPLVILDYVQMLARVGDDRVRSRVGELTKHLRVMSQALDAPILAVMSTARGFYTIEGMEKIRAKNNPLAYLPAAKESGDIEYDCASLLFLDVDQKREGVPKPARIAIAKCRSGDVGFVGARFEGTTGRWLEDASALSEMASAGDKGGQQIANEARDDTLLLEVIDKFKMMPWGEMRRMFAKRAKRREVCADDARDRLLESGKIRKGFAQKARGDYYELVTVEPPRVVPTIIAPPSSAPLELDWTKYGKKD